MSFASLSAPEKLLGQFQEKEFGHWFEYAARETRFPAAFAEDFEQMVWVGFHEVRLAKVLKTVVYVVVDEDENGEPVVEKWNVKRHTKYEA